MASGIRITTADGVERPFDEWENEQEAQAFRYALLKFRKWLDVSARDAKGTADRVKARTLRRARKELREMIRAELHERRMVVTNPMD